MSILFELEINPWLGKQSSSPTVDSINKFVRSTLLQNHKRARDTVTWGMGSHCIPHENSYDRPGGGWTHALAGSPPGINVKGLFMTSVASENTQRPAGRWHSAENQNIFEKHSVPMRGFLLPLSNCPLFSNVGRGEFCQLPNPGTFGS